MWHTKALWDKARGHPRHHPLVLEGGLFSIVFKLFAGPAAIGKKFLKACCVYACREIFCGALAKTSTAFDQNVFVAEQLQFGIICGANARHSEAATARFYLPLRFFLPLRLYTSSVDLPRICTAFKEGANHVVVALPAS